MAMTSLRAEELLCDAVVRRGGDPWGYSVLREWLLEGNGSTQFVLLQKTDWSFASPLLRTRRPLLAAAVIEMFATNGCMTACLVSNARELRDFLASGFPVAAGRVLLVGYDDLRAFSTNGPVPFDELFDTKPIALSSAPSWNMRR